MVGGNKTSKVVNGEILWIYYLFLLVLEFSKFIVEIGIWRIAIRLSIWNNFSAHIWDLIFSNHNHNGLWKMTQLEKLQMKKIAQIAHVLILNCN